MVTKIINTNIYSLILLFILSFMMGICGYWLYFDPSVITFQKEIVQTDKHQYQSGDRITYTFSYCKTKNISSIVNRALVDGIRLTYATINSNLTVGCHTVKVADLVIPNYAPTGTYHLEAIAEYKINPLRTDQIIWKSESFAVTNNDSI